MVPLSQSFSASLPEFPKLDVPGSIPAAHSTNPPCNIKAFRWLTGVARLLGSDHFLANFWQVDRQTAKPEPSDLLVGQFAVEPRQRVQRSLSELLEPVDYGALVGNPVSPQNRANNESRAR